MLFSSLNFVVLIVWFSKIFLPGYTLCLKLIEFLISSIFASLNFDLALLLDVKCVTVYYLFNSSDGSSIVAAFTCLLRRSTDSFAGVLINCLWLLLPRLVLLFINEVVLNITGSRGDSTSLSSPPNPEPKVPFTYYNPC